MGPRDDVIRPTGMAGRLTRAQWNFLETYPFFAALVLLVHIADRTGELSYWGACLYVGGRVLYLPFYALGVPWSRSLSWNVATLGLVTVGVQLFL